MYKPEHILILKHIYDKNILIYETCFNYNIADVNFQKSIYSKFIKHFNTDTSYYVWNWMDSV